VARTIPSAEPFFGGNEGRYLQECLDSGWVSSAGPQVERFERAVAARTGSAHAVATQNGTAALHVALLACGVGPGDEVLLPSLTFIATANAVRYCGAEPVFMDCEPVAWGIDPVKVREFLDRRAQIRAGVCVDRESGRTIRAILPVHVYGHAADIGPLLDLAAERSLVVIEDAAGAFGARYRGRAAGTLGRAGCLSFNGNKIVTAGGGGMLLTEDAALARRARYLTTQAAEGDGPFVHGAVGYNYRLTGLQAALGLAQLEQIERFIAAKRRHARRYAETLAGLPGVRLLEQPSWSDSTFWMSAALLDPARYGPAPDLAARARAAGIGIRPLWLPLHRQEPYAACEAYRVDLAERLHATGVCLPSSVALTEEDQDAVVAFLARAQIVHRTNETPGPGRARG
jgi:perosamine synthetase